MRGQRFEVSFLHLPLRGGGQNREERRSREQRDCVEECRALRRCEYPIPFYAVISM